MKIAYITAQIPWGRAETVILEESLEIKHRGIDLFIIPRNPPKEIFYKEAEELLENAIWLPLISPEIIFSFLKTLLMNISLWKILGAIIMHSRNPWILIKNLAVLPKGVFIAEIIQGKNIDHIHAHWGSTTATIAYIASWLTNIPWSFSLHRSGIKINNMLKEKAESVKFIRCISEHGKAELIKIIGEKYREKIIVVHMGVRIPQEIFSLRREKNNHGKFTIVTPALFLNVKGHKYLIEACSILINQGIKNFQCIFYGEGPLRVKLENLIKEKSLNNYIKMPGMVPHNKLIEMYKNREAGAVVLPSINTDIGQHEGIPVSLMEAMVYKIPVISTDTGGIPELLSNENGIVVEEKNPQQLAVAMIRLMKEENFIKEVSERGYQKIKKEFDIEKNTEILLELIKK